jgi:hypothetical protein
MMLIGFIGAPSCGKSTTSFGLCYKLKQQGYAVEFIAEYARRHIMECRVKNAPYKADTAGQSIIYGQDNANTLFYRTHCDAMTIMDGSTLNCYFYNFDLLDLADEATKYDLLFYTPVTELPPPIHDKNRIQNKTEILDMAKRWETKIRPLMAQTNNIVELPGYPHATQDQMVEFAYNTIINRFFAEERAAA